MNTETGCSLRVGSWVTPFRDIVLDTLGGNQLSQEGGPYTVRYITDDGLITLTTMLDQPLDGFYEPENFEEIDTVN